MTKASKEELQNLYHCKSLSTSKIGRIFGVGHVTVINWMKKFGIPRRASKEACKGSQLGMSKKRKYQLYENFFTNKTADMFWCLGFLAADGCIECSRTWSVCQKEKEPLSKIKNMIGYDGDIKKKKNNSEHIYRLRISSNKQVRDLELFGLTTRKSITLEFPKIPEEFFWHFVRGYFDGDGSIFRARVKVKNRIYFPVRIKFIGSMSFIKILKQEISTKLGVPLARSYKAGKNKLVEEITYKNKQTIKLITDSMYENSCNENRLYRKHHRYKLWISKYC